MGKQQTGHVEDDDEEDESSDLTESNPN